MSTSSRPPLLPSERVTGYPQIRILLALILLYLFLVGVNGLGTGFKSLGSDLVESFFRATAIMPSERSIPMIGSTATQKTLTFQHRDARPA